MSTYECSITNPKKQLEFYKDLSEQLQQENQKYKEVVNNIKNILNIQIDYREFADIVNAIDDVVKEVE